MIDERKSFILETNNEMFHHSKNHKIEIIPVMSPLLHVIELIERKEIPKPTGALAHNFEIKSRADGSIELNPGIIAYSSLGHINMTEFFIIAQNLKCRFNINFNPMLITYNEGPNASEQSELFFAPIQGKTQLQILEENFLLSAQILTSYASAEEYKEFILSASGSYLIKVSDSNIKHPFIAVVSAEHLKSAFHYLFNKE